MTTHRRMVLTVNPHGGLRSGPRVLERVKPVLEAGNVELDIIPTKYRGHAQDIAHSLDLTPYEAICVIGGDGTMHEVINGLLSRRDGSRVPIGCIPAGTGNSFMHDLGCLDPVEAAERIVQGRTKPIDLAEVSMEHKQLYAFNIVGWGLVTDINIRAEGVRWMGENRYTYSALMEILQVKRRHARLTVGREISDEKFIFILGCMTQYAGHAMWLAPRARLDDGLIDLLIVRDTNRNTLLNLFPKVFSGEHITSDKLDYRQVEEFAIIPDADDPLNIDGEIIGSTPITVKVRPHGFSTYVGADTP